MKLIKLLCGFGLLVMLASNIWTISRWSESRGVYDDICYLRQAHLFKLFGLGGLNTDIKREDDQYLANKLKEIGYPEWNVATRAPCHVWMEKTKKTVIQYPPGTGFALALFPEGFQVIPLYVLASIVVTGFALLALSCASTWYSLALAAVFGDVAIYLMINPTKASYSIAPTMMVCVLAGWLTAKLFKDGSRHRLVLLALVGLLIGLSVNLRLPNLFLSAGYCLYLAGAFLLARNRETFLQGAAFGVAFLIGMAPTLIANAINAGSPFTTTYGGQDVAPPELDASVLWQYFRDVQFTLLAIAAAWTAWLWRYNQGGARQVAILLAANLVVNAIFFMTHPIFTPYYIMPIDMLTLWTLLFATINLRGEVAAEPGFPQLAKALKRHRRSMVRPDSAGPR
ncbi:hypothetical protein [Bradyrhizobium sp. AUGA SZCCT0431]|uniref:hypothetical protein n=1 Tax=Bradyrhizobium sp. AUGA SZCCT0431 TaxID=2807674 RepID=UPI001BA49BE3|nr:hypothetical protein [Bradyrhizobium sp. AUGA SZCCT0431]MBR1145394.1 hypothetical protein [Bradyrhizobium sp. AUGA SZCCT0431]